MTRLTLLPLDDRPVSIGLPVEIAAVAGVDVDVPGRSLRPHGRRAPAPEALASWLAEARGRGDAAVVSLDALGCGSLIGSRIGHRTAVEVLGAWAPVAVPGPPVHAAIVVPRTPDSADATEEPAYWDPHGPALHALSAELSTGADPERARGRVASAVPADVVRDWLGRRLRQHTLALAALDLHRRGLLTTLVVGVDDAAERSLSAAAQRDLSRWAELTGPAGTALVHPGADETGAVLAARAVLQLSGQPAPTVAIVCADDDGLDRTAPYETGAVRLTAERQLRAAGARLTADHATADVVLVVHAPAAGPSRGDWAVAPPAHLDEDAARATAALVARVVHDGRSVAVADVAQPNGGDPALAAALGDAGLWPALTGYAGWNTAGNTLGTVAAQLVTTVVAQAAGALDAAAHRRMIARRVVEDLGWMSHVRAQVRAELGSDPTRHDTVRPDDGQRRRWEARLTQTLRATPGFADLVVRPGSLTLPWDRTFEVDLDVGTADAGTADAGTADAGTARAGTAPQQGAAS